MVKAKVYKNFNIKHIHQNSIMLIGNFDGLHLGHQRLFKEAFSYKKKFNLKKVGHLGTLDPMATGLLIIAVNRATKFASLLLQSEKSYRAEVTLGTQTDTDDAEGEVISSKNIHQNKSEVKEILLTFLGDSDQLPPNYSALKHKGKPMYKYARDGIKIMKARSDCASQTQINLSAIACAELTFISIYDAEEHH